MAALVALSGGQDSTTVAAIALNKHEKVHTITFEYGQRHRIEIECASSIAGTLGVVSHEVIDITGVLVGSSSLIPSNILLPDDNRSVVPEGVASTFIPCRNQLFLTIAANRAISLGADTVYTGVCEADYSGYPDCRRVFIDSLEATTNLGNTGQLTGLNIETPLMSLSKADSIRLALEVLGERFEKIMELTHTCYLGIKGGCGKCAACLLRDNGFKDAGVDDPIWRFRQSKQAQLLV